jgi:hypothetical protein
VTAFLRSRVDATYTVRCECDRPCATYELHWLKVIDALKATDARAAMDVADKARFEAAERAWADPESWNTDETGFSASDASFGGRAGEIVCALLAFFGFGYIIAQIAVAVARSIWGK